MKKIVEARRRDKIEEQQARQRIKEKIEQDKIARRAKFGMATPEGASSSQAPAVAPPPTPPAPTQTAVPKDYSQTKLNVSLMCPSSKNYNYFCCQVEVFILVSLIFANTVFYIYFYRFD